MPWADLLYEAKKPWLSLAIALKLAACMYIFQELLLARHMQHKEECIARLVFFVEKFWSELLRFSRRTRSQLNRWAARYGMKLCPKEQIDHAKKFMCWQIHSCKSYKTVKLWKLRLFRGTLKLNTLIATLQFVNHLCEVAISLSDQELQDMSWFDFLDMISEPELIQYLKERRLYVNEPVEQ